MQYSLRSNFKFLYTYIKAQKYSVLLLFIVLLLRIGLQVYNPRWISQFIDQAKAGSPLTDLINIALLFLAFTCLEQILVVVVRFLSNTVTWKATNALRIELTCHCLQLDPSFHHIHTPGEMVQRIDGDVMQLNSFFSMFLLQIVGSGLLLVGMLITVFCIDPLIALLLLLVIPLSLWILLMMRDFGKDALRDYQADHANLLGFIDERITGREDINTCGAHAYVDRTFRQQLKRLYRKRKITGFKIATVTNVGELVVGWITALTIGVLGFAYLNHRGLSVGDIYLVYHYITILIIPLRSMVIQIGDLQNVTATITRLHELLSLQSSVQDNGTLIIGDTPAELQFQHVSFTYEEGNEVLHDVSFTLPPGQCLGIIGKTGSGKSTIVKLIHRWYDCTQGRILLNGVDLRDIQLNNLHHNIYMVSQNVELFQGTLRDNITLFNDQITDEQLLQVIDELELKPWYATLPQGLDSEIVKDGQNVSSGEAQLICFARAFLQNPKVIILDEATSKLDANTEQSIQNALARLIRGKTSIIIAHRPATIRHTDLLMVMEQGKIIEYGATSQLEKELPSLIQGLHLITNHVQAASCCEGGDSDASNIEHPCGS